MRKLALFLIVLGFSFSLHADFVTGERAFSNKRYSEALQQFRPLAEAGDFRAQYYMAYMYLNGYGVTRNDALGLEYLQKSLDQNYHLAQALMGFLYSRGEVVPADYKKAISLYQKAADQGNTSAMLNLGVAYYLGDGVPRNLVRAVELLEKIPVDQQPAAGRYLGDIYMTRNAEKVDQAINAYRSAAAAGDLPSYVALAEIYQKGQGVTVNNELALQYYNYAASQGYAPAQYALGLMYVNGQNVAQSPVMGHAWLTWAANQGYDPAMSALNQLKSEMTLSDLDRSRQEFFNIQQQVLGKIAAPISNVQQQKTAEQQSGQQSSSSSSRRRRRRRR